MHPNSPSYRNKDISQVYIQHEKEKKRAYNDRIIHVEKASFTPIVMSTFGGMGPEADRFHQRLATLISVKRNETYASVVNFIRTRLRFCLLKSVLMSIRGVRGRSVREKISPISSLSFNLINFEEDWSCTLRIWRVKKMHCLWKTNEVYLLYVVVVDAESDVVADSDITSYYNGRAAAKLKTCI